MSTTIDHSATRIASRAENRALLRARAEELREQALAANTRRLYDKDQADYAAWCALHGYQALPADPVVVADYLGDLASQTRADGTPRLKPSSISRHLAAISRMNDVAGFGARLGKHPLVADTMKGIRAEGDSRVSRARPLLLDDYRSVIEAMDHSRFPSGVTAARDTLALGLGLTVALRRSEAAGLRSRDVRLEHDGLHVYVAKSKTDQAGQGVTLAVPYGHHAITCIPCALIRWTHVVAASTRDQVMAQVFAVGRPETWKHVCRSLQPAEIDPDAPLLRRVDRHGNVYDVGVSGSALGEAIKRRVADAGLDPRRYTFHSLRAGFVTQARRNGADAREVRRQTRHGSDAMVALYDREFNPLQGSGVLRLGL